MNSLPGHVRGLSGQQLYNNMTICLATPEVLISGGKRTIDGTGQILNPSKKNEKKVLPEQHD